MKILYNIKRLPHLERPLVTIGIFDGVHLGHQKLLKKLVKKAHSKRRPSLVITFTPHPYKILYPERIPPMLLSLSHRLKVLEGQGIDYALIFRFTRHLAHISAEHFIEKVLVGNLNIGELFIGEDFTLGYNKKGTLKKLKELSRQYNFRLNIIKNKKINNKIVSSTRIRNMILKGQFKKASVRLGRKFSILGTVIKGDRRGRHLGFPTSNLNPHHEAIPPSGVYAVEVIYDKNRYKGVLNIGSRPTFKESKGERTIEVHIFNFKKNIYNRDLEVIFIEKIREERHFKYKTHLREQIEKDIKKARKILS